MRVFCRILSVVLCVCSVLFCASGCAPTDSPERAFAYAAGDFSATVSGTVTRLTPDGYVGNPALVGDRLTEVPRSFEATVSVYTDAAGCRVETVTYTAPPTLCGLTVTVTRETTPDAASAPQVRLVRGEVSAELSSASESHMDALLLPLGLLLPAGDIVAVSPSDDGRFTVTRRASDGSETVFTFAEGESLPVAVTARSARQCAECVIRH